MLLSAMIFPSCCACLIYTSSIPFFDPQKTAREVIDIGHNITWLKANKFFILKIHCFIFADNKKIRPAFDQKLVYVPRLAVCICDWIFYLASHRCLVYVAQCQQ